MSIHPPTAAAATASAMANLKAILMCPYALPCASRVAAIPLFARRSLPRSPFLPRRIVDLPSPPLYGKPGSTTSLSAAGRRMSIRAAHISDSGPINSPMMSSMEKKIKEQLNADEVCVRDAYGDGRHVSIDVIASAFEGQSAVNRQRMVYKAIWEELQSTVHAVDQMTTRTPTEAAATSQNS